MSGRGSGGAGQTGETAGAVAGEPAPGGAFGDLCAAGGAGEWNAAGQMRFEHRVPAHRFLALRGGEFAQFGHDQW